MKKVKVLSYNRPEYLENTINKYITAGFDIIDIQFRAFQVSSGERYSALIVYEEVDKNDS